MRLTAKCVAGVNGEGKGEGEQEKVREVPYSFSLPAPLRLCRQRGVCLHRMGFFDGVWETGPRTSLN